MSSITLAARREAGFDDRTGIIGYSPAGILLDDVHAHPFLSLVKKAC
jgi:hypothetical protein